METCPVLLSRDSQFFNRAWNAASLGLKYTRELLKMGDRKVVLAAMEIVTKQWQEAENARLRNIKQMRIVFERRKERERPTREAIREAYEECQYRRSKQGHRTHIYLSLEYLPEIAITNNRTQSLPCGLYREENLGSYSGRCQWTKKGSVHSLYVRPNYLNRMKPLGQYTFVYPVNKKKCLILDADHKGYATDGRPVYSIRLLVQALGNDIRTEDVTVVVRPLTVGSQGMQTYWGKVLKKREICKILELGTDTPDFALVDRAIEKEILSA